MQIRTDLALEAREYVEDANGALRGVCVEKEKRKETGIEITTVKVVTKNGEKALGKPMGTYVTLEIPGLDEEAEEKHVKVAEEISLQIKKLLPESEGQCSVLLVGLGNREITADSLGPRVVEQVEASRHLIMEFGTKAEESVQPMMVSTIAAGVMAKTGMESAEIVKGIVNETKPDAVIVVDALAARSVKRLNRTIQLSTAGIHPGSGVGNHRHAIDEKTLQIPVIAVGVPTVVDGGTIVWDAFDDLHRKWKDAVFLQAKESGIFARLNNMMVTPKDIDATIKCVSTTLAEALNMTFKGELQV